MHARRIAGQSDCWRSRQTGLIAIYSPRALLMTPCDINMIARYWCDRHLIRR